MTTPTSYVDWIEFYSDTANMEVANTNQHADALLNLTDTDASTSMIMALLTNCTAAGFIAAIKTNENDKTGIFLSHHTVVQTPFTLLDVNVNKFYAINGLFNNSQIIETKPKWFAFQEDPITAPTPDDILKGIEAGLKLNDIEPNPENPGTGWPTEAVVIPPLLILPISNHDSKDLDGIIKTCITTIKHSGGITTTISDDEDEAEQTNATLNQYGRILQFLWMHAKETSSAPTLTPNDINYTIPNIIKTKMKNILIINGVLLPPAPNNQETTSPEIPIAITIDHPIEPQQTAPNPPPAITPNNLTFASPPPTNTNTMNDTTTTTGTTTNNSTTANTINNATTPPTTTNMASNTLAPTDTDANINRLILVVESFVQSQQVASTNATNNFARLVQAQEASVHEKSGTHKWTNRVMAQNQKLILHASQPTKNYQHTNTNITEPNKEYKEIIETAKHGLIECLQTALYNTRKLNMAIDINLSTAIWTGSIRNPHHDIPERLSIFFCAPRDIAKGPSSGFNNRNEWELCVETNNVSAEQIKNATKSKIIITKDLPGLVQQIENFRGILDLLFTKKSAPYQAVDSWLTELDQEKQLYRILISENPRFIAGTLAMIDARVQRFFTKCIQAETFQQVDYGILNFSVIFEMMQMRTPLPVAIPSVIQDALNKQNQVENQKAGGNAGGTPSQNKGEGNNKRKAQHPNNVTPNQDETKKKLRFMGNQAKNPDANPDWTAKSQNFARFNQKINTLPKTPDGGTICAKYHVHGTCNFGEACARASSHKKLDPKTATDLAKWVIDCTKDNS